MACRLNWLLRGIWDLSFPTRDQTCILCTARWILNHSTTREVPRSLSCGRKDKTELNQLEPMQLLVPQSCLTLCSPMDCSLPGSSVRGISQAGILEWVAVSFSKGSSQSRDRTQVSCIAGRLLTIWATREIKPIQRRLQWAFINTNLWGSSEQRETGLPEKIPICGVIGCPPPESSVSSPWDSVHHYACLGPKTLVSGVAPWPCPAICAAVQGSGLSGTQCAASGT